MNIDYPAWMEHGLCAQTDPAIFFPEKGGSTKDARKVCAECSVRAVCLDWAVSHPETLYGIWGGLSEDQRRPMRGRKQRGAA